MQEDAIVATAAGEEAVPIHAVKAEELPLSLGALGEGERRFATAQGFKAEAGRVALLPDAAGGLGRVLFGVGAADAAERGPLLFGKLAPALPAGLYRLADGVEEPALAALAFALGAYRFERYRKPKESIARLAVPDGVDAAALVRVRDGIFLARPHQHSGQRSLAA
jgi:leucyl aminopeptidase